MTKTKIRINQCGLIYRTKVIEYKRTLIKELLLDIVAELKLSFCDIFFDVSLSKDCIIIRDINYTSLCSLYVSCDEELGLSFSFCDIPYMKDRVTSNIGVSDNKVLVLDAETKEKLVVLHITINESNYSFKVDNFTYVEELGVISLVKKLDNLN